MKSLVTTVALVVTLMLPLAGRAQVTGDTGQLGFELNQYGRMRINTPTWASGTRQLDRAAMVAALDTNHVFDYEEDAENVQGPSLITVPFADVAASVLTDNSYSGLEPNIQVRIDVYGWNNDSFVIAKYTVININASAYQLYLGVAVIPEPSDTYGGETVAWDSTKKVGYYFRAGETPHLGVKVLSGAPYSFHVLDFDVYSPADPSSDAATDSTRFMMTAPPGFDQPLQTASADGSIYNVNVGKRTIAAGDSTSFTVAYVYSDSLAGLLAACDSAVARYTGKFTSVGPATRSVPTQFVLSQNYPNPFNPTTKIAFTLKSGGFTTLKVYDILGREVGVVVNETLTAGQHVRTFDAHGLASGVYIYKLTSGNFTATKRMVVLK